MEKKNAAVLSFLDRKGVHPSAKLYFVDAMGSMALALFASLLMGTILAKIGELASLPFLTEVADYANKVTGIVLGVAIASTLKAPPLVLYSAGAVGLMGYNMGAVFSINGVDKALTGGPAGAFLCVLVATELGKLIAKETKIDILITPLVTLLSGYGVALLICPAVSYLMYYTGDFINMATVLHPIPMGILIAVAVGMILTLPISSAAICAMIGIGGIAGGAAVAGCCAQMVGFAVISYRENKFGGLIAQGLGTSMLQMGNIVKNPRIWIPATLASAVTGPLSTTLFGLKCNGVAAGMGTCGLVGPLGVLAATPQEEQTALFFVGFFLVCFILPAVLSLSFAVGLRKIGWIKENDLKLDL